MTSETLTTFQRILLQRYYDGELSNKEREEALNLLERSPLARTFLETLNELSLSVRESEALLWEQVEAPSVDELLAGIFGDDGSEVDDELTLEELAPLLERFHDGELTDEEHQFVIEILATREDCVDYLAAMDVVGAAIRGAVDETMVQMPSFDGFWDGIDKAIEEDAHTPSANPINAPADDAVTNNSPIVFVHDDHAVLLYRYFDDEVTAGERATVDAWIAAGDPDVVQRLDAMKSLRLAVQAGIEQAQEKVDFTAFWDAVEGRLDGEPAVDNAPEGGVVSLAQARENRKKKGFFPQSMSAFAAAAIVLIAMGALLKDSFFPNEKVIIKERTVVIVDSIEYAPGASVMVQNPRIAPVNLKVNESANVGVANKSISEEGEDDEEMTIIWLFEESEEDPADFETNDSDERFNGPI